LRRAYSAAPRDSVYALLFGEPLACDAVTPVVTSVLMPDSGLAILRTHPEVQVALKYGPHGGAHGHPDKLSVTGYDRGWHYSPDLGTPGYGVQSLESWYRQTLSHNTVLIDGESQDPGQGSLRRFETRSRCHVAEAAIGWHGLAMRRTVLACAEYFIDAFEVVCDRERRIDWIWHNAGEVGIDDPGQRLAGLEGGTAYRHLEDLHEVKPPVPSVTWRDGDRGMAAWMRFVAGERIVAGLAPANPPSTRFGFVLRMRHASATTFLTVFHPFRIGATVEAVEWEAERVRVRLRDRVDDWPLADLLPPG
jgi:hypothetical protein